MKSFVAIVIWAFINAFPTGCGAKLPSKYVMATLNGYHTHAELGPDPMPTLETRVSTDGGRTWAAPKTPKTCVLPVQPHSCSLTEIRTWIEPGLASNNEKYVLVFFHNNYDEDLHAVNSGPIQEFPCRYLGNSMSSASMRSRRWLMTTRHVAGWWLIERRVVMCG